MNEVSVDKLFMKITMTNVKFFRECKFSKDAQRIVGLKFIFNIRPSVSRVIAHYLYKGCEL